MKKLRKYTISSEIKDLVILALADFKEAYNHILTLETNKQKYLYLKSVKMHNGFCYYTQVVHKTYTCNEPFVYYYKLKVEPYTAYWCHTPQDAFLGFSPLTIEETMKKRIVILEEIISQK